MTEWYDPRDYETEAERKEAEEQFRKEWGR